jgi:hypothetical protein
MNKRGGWVRAFSDEQKQKFKESYEKFQGNADRARKEEGFRYSAVTYRAVWKSLGLIGSEKESGIEKKVYELSASPSALK